MGAFEDDLTEHHRMRERDQTIEALRKELAERAEAHYTDAAAVLKEWKAATERAEAECGAMREALRPFAKIADDYDAADARSAEHHKDGGRTYRPRSDSHRTSVALGDCRKARAALNPSPAGREG